MISKEQQIAQAGPYPSRRLGKREQKVLEVANQGLPQVVSVVYDFDTQGGVIGSLDTGSSLPAGAIVQSVIADIGVTPTSTGSTGHINIAAGSTTLMADIDADGTKSGLLTSTGPTKSATEQALNILLEDAAITAGQITFHVTYIVP